MTATKEMKAVEEMFEKKEVCMYGICDGSGIEVVGNFDDFYERPCPCSAKVADEYDNQLD